MERVGSRGRQQRIADTLPSHQSGNPGQRLHVLPGSAIGADQHEEQPDRLTIKRFEWYPLGTAAADQAQLGDQRGFGVRNGNAMTDASGEHLLPLQHGGQQSSGVGVGTLSQQLGQFAEHAGFIGGRQRDPDAIGGEKLGEQQSCIGASM